MLRMTCDNDCTTAGWKEYFAAGGEWDLHISVSPESDLDGVVIAFCHDEQEMIKLHGWNFIFSDITDATLEG